MADKQTYARAGIWDPDLEGNTTKQIATAGREITNLKLVASAGAATIELYDAVSVGNANYSNLVWVLDSSTQDTDDDSFANPLSFKNGIYAKLVQGAGLNAKFCYAYIPDQV